jgi:predicted metalloprotease with PDZ domain
MSISRAARSALLASAAAMVMATAATAQTPPPPVSSPMPAAITTPQDVAYPGGVIRLHVNATDLDRRIFQVKETIPVAGAGPMTLLFPKWLPGHHSPSGPLDQMAGLIITADGKRVEWTRDTVDVFAFHIDVPAGAKTVELAFQFLSPTNTNQGRVVVTPEMLNVQWNALTFYPAGYYARHIPVQASVTVPDGWQIGGALERETTTGATTSFKVQPLDILIDSPLYVGKYFKRYDLDPGAKVPVHLNVVGDTPESVEAKPEQIEPHRRLVQQAYKVFRSQHYDRYEFLLSLSDKMSGQGLEHHRSSENGVGPGYFTEWDKSAPDRDLLPHEYTHSWNGKFRRGADLWTANYDVPMRDSLLWLYEGQTQYWGYVLAARSGLWTKQQALDSLALTAALYDARIGREWRAMVDTTNDPIITTRRPIAWRSWQRSEDYYSEGQLMWLEADQLIRQQTNGKKSLDDFAAAFFGIYDGSFSEVTYTRDDVVKALNGVMPYDWAGFLNQRLEGHGPGAPLKWIEMGGYKLSYLDKPSEMQKANEAQRKNTDLTYSLGLTVNSAGVLGDVLWQGPAFKAGLTGSQTIVAVNEESFSPDKLRKAVTAAKGSGPAVQLLMKNGERYRTVTIDYHGGLRFPHLEPVGTKPAGLDALLAPRS